MKHHLAGATLSTLVHLGILLIAFGLLLPDETKRLPEKPVPIKLSMFQPPVNKQPETPKAVKPAVKQTPKKEPPKFVKPKTKPKPKPKPKKKRLPKPEIKPEPEPPRIVPEITREPVASPPPQPAQVTTRKAPVRENIDELNKITRDYQAALQSGIEANKHYPRRARRSRQQGRCIVAFTVLQNGQIKDIRIVKSSGSNALDQASLAAVRSIDGQYPIPSKLGRSRWVFSVPVQYQLR